MRLISGKSAAVAECSYGAGVPNVTKFGCSGRLDLAFVSMPLHVSGQDLASAALPVCDGFV
jgi:hypothetical protein